MTETDGRATSSGGWRVPAAAFLGALAGAAGVAAMLALRAPVPSDVPLPDPCRDAGERLAEVATLLEDAAAPTLASWEAGRLLAAASGTLSAVAARLHRHGGCRAADIAALRGRIAASRAAALEQALAPVRAALAAEGAVVEGRPAHAAMAELARARVALARAAADGGGDGEDEPRILQRQLEAAYAGWAREQQRRHDLWALGQARALDRWARQNLSDIPLRGAGRDEIAGELVRQLGPVDVRLTGPAVQAVHAELFQRLWRELGEEARIAVVADLVAAPKRHPEEF